MEYPYTGREMLDFYVANGGNILFSIYQPSLAFELNSSYPGQFCRNHFHERHAGDRQRRLFQRGPFQKSCSLVNGYPAIEVDPDKTNASFNHHIIRVEGMNTDGQSTAIYDYGSDYADDSAQGALNGMRVGILNQRGSGKAVTLSFPLYNMYASQARALVRHVFTTEFGEFASSSDDPSAPSTPALMLEAPHPNPFSASTALRLSVKNPSLPVSVTIYNQRGQMVRKLFRVKAEANVLSGDGNDDDGRP
jgi:hypothetical protein